MDKRVIKKVQKLELSILDEIDRICEKHNISYFLIAGSLIGAIRHKGFIPWDDDLDIAMVRADYDKFIEICSKELNEKYIIDSSKTSKKYHKIAAKIRIKNSEYVEKELENYDGNQGIWVDILPLDYSNKNKSIKLSFQNTIKKVFCSGLVVKCKVKNNMNIFNKIIAKIISFLPYSFLHKIIDKVVKMQNRGNKKYVVNFASKYGIKKQTFEYDIYFPIKKELFEKKEYPIPNKYDEYLTQIYGNYMKIPPIEKREIHNPIRIKFPDGEEIDFNEKI